MNTSLSLSALGALALLAGCGRPASDSSAGAALPPVAARVVAVRVETLPSLTEVTGTIQAVERAQLAAKVMGPIEDMPIALGQRVKRGDALVTIGAGEIKARVAQAESQYNQASRDLARERDLLPKGASTAAMVKDLEDRCAGAEAALGEARAMLGYATLRAPFDGVIAQKLANVGDLASPGLPLVGIDGLKGFEVEAGIPDSLAGNLGVGAALTVQPPDGGRAFPGRISAISSAADPGAHTVAVKIAVPEGVEVRSGQFVTVQVPGAPIRALLAPASAVAAVGQMERVFVVGPDNRAVLRLVRTGARRGDRVEILAGLDDGDRVIASPSAALREGEPLEIQP
jgi:RND family efflux transporter MFP subunit